MKAVRRGVIVGAVVMAAFATGTVMSAQTPRDSSVIDSRYDGVLSDGETDDVEGSLRSNSTFKEISARYGTTLDKWTSAEIEGQPRGAATTVRLNRPTSGTAPALRVDETLLARSYFPDKVA